MDEAYPHHGYDLVDQHLHTIWLFFRLLRCWHRMILGTRQTDTTTLALLPGEKEMPAQRRHGNLLATHAPC